MPIRLRLSGQSASLPRQLSRATVQRNAFVDAMRGGRVSVAYRLLRWFNLSAWRQTVLMVHVQRELVPMALVLRRASQVVAGGNMLGLFCEVFAWLVRCKLAIEEWKRSGEEESNQ